VVLSGTQRSVVDVLLKFEGQVVDRSVLAQVLRVESNSRAVDMAISRLRRSLVSFPFEIETVRRRGYRLRRA
jgi:DNA-binding response OmpR family regulator